MIPRLNRIGWLLAVGFAWVWVWKHLAIEWGNDEQYQFGFGVPFLFLYAAWQRWQGPMQPGQGGAAVRAVVILIAWTFMVLGELLRWQDPIWRVTGGLLTISATLLTGVWFHRVGGWLLLRRELFPLGFAWLALPWPVQVELIVTQRLLSFVTAITVSIVNACGIAALQRGNVIELSNGVVGMEGACSGVHSLQAAFMASLFLGEFYRLSVGRRCALVIAGWSIALFTNLGRVFALVLITHIGGQAEAANWHDFVGGSVSVVTFLLLLAVASWMTPGRAPVQVAEEQRINRLFPEGMVVFGVFAAIPLVVWTSFSAASIPIAELGETPRWRVDVSGLPPGWMAEPRPAGPGEKTMLRFSQWEGYRVRSPEGLTLQVLHLFWKPGRNMPSMAFYHTPALCMPSMGWAEAEPPRQMGLDIQGIPMEWVGYHFSQGGKGQVVLQSLLSGGKSEALLVNVETIGGRMERLATLWQAPRRQINEEILLYMPASESVKWQLRTAREFLESVLRVNER